MKQARKAGMSLLQRLGTDAHYAFVFPNHVKMVCLWANCAKSPSPLAWKSDEPAPAELRIWAVMEVDGPKPRK